MFLNTEMDAFVAVSVYVVVSAGVTFTLVPFTAPIPVRSSEVAPVTLHWSNEFCPGWTVGGDALRLLITGVGFVGNGAGEDAAAMATVADAHFVESTSLVAVTVAVPAFDGAV